MLLPKSMAISVWIAIFAAAGCTGGAHVEKVSESPSDTSGPARANVDLSLATTAEAELLALCVSETLFPLPDLVEEIHQDLAAIRSAYGFPPIHSTHPRARWTNAIEIQFAGTAGHEFAMGAYYQWNDLNAQLGPVSILPLESERAELEFTATINPCLAAKLYQELPGIVSATPLFDGADGPDIYIGFSTWSGYTYLFRYAYDGCENQCLNEEYYYFRFIDVEPVLVGRWDPALADAPAWWYDVEYELIECSCLPPAPPSPKKIRGK